MNKYTNKSVIFFIWVLIGFTSMGLYAQEGYKKGSLRIKFNKTEEARLRTMRVEKSADGIVRTGIVSIDQLNEKHKASTIQRVFPDAGKFEKKHQKYGLHLWYEIVVDQKSDMIRTSREYAKLAEISVAEPVYEKKRGLERENSLKNAIQTSLPSGTNDPLYNEQWHYNNTGQTGGTVDADIDLPEAWMIETGSPDIIVSVHDGGIDTDHIDLGGNMWINPGEIAGNGIDDDNNGYVDDVYGYNFADDTGNIIADDHGTHVAGIIACETNNNTGMAGIAGGSGSDDGVRLMSCAVFANAVGGFPASYVYAADNGSVISQNSWGYSSPNVYEQALLDAIDYFIAEAGTDEAGNQTGPMAGGIVIFAAGNDGTNDLWYPGYYDKVMAVAGTDHNDNKYTSSNYGPWVELAAPGVNVSSTIPNDEYTSLSGTSMACPHVSGVAALVLSHFKEEGITPQQLWNRLVNTTDPLTFDGAEDWGTGRLNAFNALAENDGQPPDAITDLQVGEITAVSMTFSWTAPADQPDNYPAIFYDFRVSLNPITAGNFDQSTTYEVPAPKTPGETESVLISGLSPGTTYYFAVKSADYFENTSGISNVISTTTATAPEIVITGNPGVEIDVTVSPVETGEFTIGNQGPVDLNYDIVPVYRGRVATQSGLIYPGRTESIVSLADHKGQAMLNSEPSVNNNTVAQFAFDTDVAYMISYDDGDEEADGEIAVTAGGDPVDWSAATAFEVPDMNGEKFILTHISTFINAEGAATSKPTKISVIAGGETPSQGELLLMQEFNNITGAQYVTVSLEMPVAFHSGDKFWVVHNFPDVPLSMGYDDVPGGNRPNSYLAYLNGEWTDIQSVSGWSNYVWNVRAIQSALQGVSLNIYSGTLVNGASQNVEVTYDATGMIRNGDYQFDIFILSNDPVTPVEKVEATAKVKGLPEASIEVQPDTINSQIDVVIHPVKTEMLTIFNHGTGELLFDFYNPVIEEAYHIPSATRDYPRGSAVESSGVAPFVSTKAPLVAPVIKLSGSVAYAHEVYPNSLFVSIETGTPGTYATSSTVSYTAYAGDFSKGDDKHMYIVDDNSSELKKLNIETGDLTTLGTTLNFSDFACDKETGTMYAAFYNDPSSELYIVNLINGNATKVGTMGDGVMISMACDGEGNLWGLNLDDNLYAIDKNDGHMTLVGSVGFDVNYAQSMAWDPLSGNIYMAAYNNASNSGELRVVDIQTGATQLLGAFPNNAEVTAFGFPGGGSNDFISVSPTSGTVAVNSSMNIQVQLDATELPNGQYSSSLSLYSNDFNKLSTSIPVNLEVTGQVGAIDISTNFMEFGAVFLNGEKEMPLVISNSGVGDLTVAGIASNMSLFTTNLVAPAVLGKGDSLVVKVRFASHFLGQFNGILTLSSDDPDRPQIQITVTATAISPPVISLHPTGLETTMEAGEVKTEHFTIRNFGLYPLQYSLPSVAVNRLLENSGVQQNNTSYIEGLAELNSKDQPDDRTGHPVLLGAGGPDESGYQWIDSKESGGPVFNWSDISTSGTEILPDSDDGFLEADIPFGFKFYGELQTKITIGANGYLTFGEEGGDYSNDQIPSVATPNNLIAPFWDDLRPGDRPGKIFYQASEDQFVVQYQEVGNYPGSSSGTITFQVVLYPSGNIAYFYKEISLENRASASIGIENKEGTTGLQVAFNTDFVEDSLAVLFFPGRTPFQVNASPVSGIVQPNREQVIELVLDTKKLTDGAYINELLVSSNDPVRPGEVFTTKLNVVGHPQMNVTPDSVVFSPIFQGLTEVKKITIENRGSKELIISTIYSDEASFTVDVTTPMVIAPAKAKTIDVTYTVIQIGDVIGSVTIESNDEFGNQLYPVFVKGTGLVPPEMTVTTSPSPVHLTMNSGEIDTLTVHIENSGGSPLDYVLVKPYYTNKGDITVNAENPTPELSAKEVPDTRRGEPVQSGKGGPDQWGYTWMDSDEGTEIIYEWIEIKEIGTKLDLGADNGVMINMPFNFPFYNGVYHQVQVASNGFLTFGEDLGFIGGYSNQDIPLATAPNNLIAPLWDDIEPQDGDGVYVYAAQDYVVIQYNEVPKFFGTGNATFQAILYATGDIKFQYKDVGNYSGTDDSTVGIENADGSDALKVVFNSAYVKDELAVMIQSPFITGSVGIGQTAHIDLIVDASEIYDGIYEAPLKVLSNDPANMAVEIPTRLTVIGTPQISLSQDTVFFDTIYYMDGENYSDTKELIIRNEGTRAMQIDSVWFDPENPVFDHDQSGSFTLGPKEEQIVSLTFTPGAVGDFHAFLFVSGNDSLHPVVSAQLFGTAVAPPVFSVTPTDTLELELNSGESAIRTAVVHNLGGSVLEYETNIVYLPGGFDQVSQVQRIYQRKTIDQTVYRTSVPASNAGSPGYSTFGVSFVDSIMYDPERAPDDYYGYNGTAAYSSANKFVVTGSSFELTHLSNYYQNEGDTTPVVLEIYKGGGLPAEGTLVATQTFTHAAANGGANCFIELQTPQSFVQGDEFFVVIHYPESIPFPAAFNSGVAGVDGVSYWYDANSNTWLPEDAGYVYKIRAYQAAGSSVESWLSIDPETGELPAGDSLNHQLLINAAATTGGFHFARVVYTSNDPLNTSVEWPVRLYVNKLPEVLVAPDDTLFINEGGHLEIPVFAIDPEGGTIDYQMAGEYPFTSLIIIGDSALVTYAPDYEQAGSHFFAMNIIDDRGEAITIFWMVVVIDVNRAPVLLADVDNRLYFPADPEDEIDLSQYFADPDRDSFVFSASASTDSVCTLHVEDHMLYITPVDLGLAVVTVRATDPQGEYAALSFTVRVRHVENHAPELIGVLDHIILSPSSPPVTVNLDHYFYDRDWDEITYHFQLTGTPSVHVSLAGSELQITPWRRGMAVLTVYADDNRGGITATTVGILVIGNRNGLPFLSSLLGNRTYTTTSSQDNIDLSQVFDDPDGDPLTYIAKVESGEAVEVEVKNNILMVTPVHEGESTIVVYASDENSGIANTRFIAMVSTVTGIEDMEETKINLRNYPNPVDYVTTIAYEIEKQSHVRLEVINAYGSTIGTLVNQHQAKGKYTLDYHVEKLTPGVYYYQLIIDGKPLKTNKMVVK